MRPTSSRPVAQRRNIPRKPKNQQPVQFLLSVDLGQKQDYTAITIIERQGPNYLVREAWRLPLGMPYPDIIDHVGALLKSPNLRDKTKLIIDGTGVGIPVADMFHKAGLRPVPISITGGNTVSTTGRIFNVPKRDLASVLQVCFETGRIKISGAIDLKDTLVKELMNFKVKITSHGNDTYGAWRENIHDDLVLSLAIGLWCGERMKHAPQTELFIRGIN